MRLAYFLTVMSLMTGNVTSRRAIDYCDGKPLGKYCLADGSGYFACTVDEFSDLDYYFHKCPVQTRCICLPDKPCQYNDEPCVRSDQPSRPQFAKRSFGTMAITDTMCQQNLCKTKVTVSEKYQEAQRSREELIQDLTQRVTVLLLPTGKDKWTQYFVEHSQGTQCSKRELDQFPALNSIPDDFDYNGEVKILGFTCQDWVHKFGENATRRGFVNHLPYHRRKSVTLSHAGRFATRSILTKDEGTSNVKGEIHIYVARIGEKFFPLKVQQKEKYLDSNTTVFYNEIMTQYFAERKLQIPELFKLPQACLQAANNASNPYRAQVAGIAAHSMKHNRKQGMEKLKMKVL